MDPTSSSYFRPEYVTPEVSSNETMTPEQEKMAEFLTWLSENGDKCTIKDGKLYINSSDITPEFKSMLEKIQNSPEFSEMIGKMKEALEKMGKSSELFDSIVVITPEPEKPPPEKPFGMK